MTFFPDPANKNVMILYPHLNKDALLPYLPSHEHENIPNPFPNQADITPDYQTFNLYLTFFRIKKSMISDPPLNQTL